MARIAALLLLLEEIEFPCATRQSAPLAAMRMFPFVYLRGHLRYCRRVGFFKAQRLDYFICLNKSAQSNSTFVNTATACVGTHN